MRSTEWLQEGVTIDEEILPDFSGPDGAFRTNSFDANLLFLWDNLYHKSGGRCPCEREALREEENKAC
eukprot:1160414-Pelagomonas_calceolata.AAC.1